MKKITALIVAVMMLLSLAAIPAFAEVTDADYVQDGWGKERELKEGDRWNIQYLFGRETPANGFSFYGKTSEETKFTPTTYKEGRRRAPRFRSSAKCRLRIISLTTEAQTLFSTFIPLTVK